MLKFIVGFLDPHFLSQLDSGLGGVLLDLPLQLRYKVQGTERVRLSLSLFFSSALI